MLGIQTPGWVRWLDSLLPERKEGTRQERWECAFLSGGGLRNTGTSGPECVGVTSSLPGCPDWPPGR